MTATPVFPQTIQSVATKFVPADTTTLKTIFTPGANGSLINRIWITSTDTSARDFQLYVTISGTDYILGTLSIPANSGNTNAVPQVGVFESSQFPNMFLDNNGNKIMRLASGSVLKAKMLSSITSAKEVSVFIQGGDF